MSADPYTVLGVKRTAADDEIRKAYRDLAKKLHPDLNPGDAAAADRFKQVSAAYEILKDADKRARYDRGEIDERGAEKPRQQTYRDYADAGQARRYSSSAGYEDFGDLSGIFGDLFGGRAGASGAGARIRSKGADARYRMEVDFLDAARGGTSRITTPDGRALDLKIPAGAQEGSILRLRGEGGPGFNGGPNGDALIELSVRPHPYFTREGDDILIDVPISLDEAVLGAKVEAPTIDGRVAIAVPKGASSGQTLRLRGKGVAKDGGGRGDQLVRLLIVSPSEIDDELAKFMESWRTTKAYDPRKGLWRKP